MRTGAASCVGTFIDAIGSLAELSQTARCRTAIFHLPASKVGIPQTFK